jgi:hypothetical protein
MRFISMTPFLAPPVAVFSDAVSADLAAGRSERPWAKAVSGRVDSVVVQTRRLPARTIARRVIGFGINGIGEPVSNQERGFYRYSRSSSNVPTLEQTLNFGHFHRHKECKAPPQPISGIALFAVKNGEQSRALSGQASDALTWQGRRSVSAALFALEDAADMNTVLSQLHPRYERRSSSVRQVGRQGR